MLVHLLVTLSHVNGILDKISLSGYVSSTTHKKAFIFGPWVPYRVSFELWPPESCHSVGLEVKI